MRRKWFEPKSGSFLSIFKMSGDEPYIILALRLLYETTKTVTSI